MHNWRIWRSWQVLTFLFVPPLIPARFLSDSHVLFKVSTIEFSLVEVSVLHGLQQGNEVLKEIHKELNVENVERIMEETAEAREYQRVSLRP